MFLKLKTCKSLLNGIENDSILSDNKCLIESIPEFIQSLITYKYFVIPSFFNVLNDLLVSIRLNS